MVLPAWDSSVVRSACLVVAAPRNQTQKHTFAVRCVRAMQSLALDFDPPHPPTSMAKSDFIISHSHSTLCTGDAISHLISTPPPLNHLHASLPTHSKPYLSTHTHTHACSCTAKSKGKSTFLARESFFCAENANFFSLDFFFPVGFSPGWSTLRRALLLRCACNCTAKTRLFAHSGSPLRSQRSLPVPRRPRYAMSGPERD